MAHAWLRCRQLAGRFVWGLMKATLAVSQVAVGADTPGSTLCEQGGRAIEQHSRRALSDWLSLVLTGPGRKQLVHKVVTQILFKAAH